MNSPKIENARVYKVCDTETVGTADFKKRQLWLTINEDTQYPDVISVEATQLKVAIFDGLTAGDIIDVDTHIRGRIWTDKMGVEKAFTTLNAWKVTVKEKAATAAPAPSWTATVIDEEEEELPF